MPRPAMSGRGSVDGLEQSAARARAERCRRQQSQRAGEHRGFVGEDVAEHVFRHDHVEVARPLQKMHGGRVHQHVLEAHVGKFAGHDPIDHRAPEARGLEHVGLVDRGQFAAAGQRQARRQTHHAFDFFHGVAANVDGFGRGARLLAEVDAAGQLAHHHDVHAAQSSALIGEACSTAGCGTTGRRLANSPSALRSCSRPCSGRTGASGADHFGPPTAPEQNCVGALRQRQRGRRQRLSRRIDGGAAEQRRLEFKGVPEARGHRAQGPHRLGRDFAADAVAGEEPRSAPSLAMPHARRFVALDVAQLAAQIAEFIDAVQQAVPREGLQGKGDRHAGGQRQARGF